VALRGHGLTAAGGRAGLLDEDGGIVDAVETVALLAGPTGRTWRVTDECDGGSTARAGMVSSAVTGLRSAAGVLRRARLRVVESVGLR
jgi:hypothetical protein